MTSDKRSARASLGRWCQIAAGAVLYQFLRPSILGCSFLSFTMGRVSRGGFYARHLRRLARMARCVGASPDLRAAPKEAVARAGIASPASQGVVCPE